MKKITLVLSLILCCFITNGQNNITFSVDMTGYNTTFTTPEVNGTFNGWCGNCNPMTDADMDGIWEATISIPDGTHEFKFSHDSWTGQENLTAGSSCTITTSGFTNRTLVVSGSDMVLPTVCWDSCDATCASSSSGPTSAPPTPIHAAGDVISLFSDAYTSSATLNLASFTPMGNTATVVSAAGNDVYELVIAGGVFHGFDLSGAIDLTTMQNMHYDVWIAGTTPPGGVFNTTVSYHAGGHLTGQTTGYVDTNAIAQGMEGQWLSFDIPFSDFAPDMSMNPRDIISQIVFTHANLSDVGPIYVDNIYFWRDNVSPMSDASLSDLQVDGSTVAGFSSTTLSYNIELPNGTTTVPTVTATATQAGMGSSNVSFTPAASLPGTTNVQVTAPDGTTMETYMVNFTVAPLEPTMNAPQSSSTGTDLYVYSDITGTFVTNFNFNAFQGGGTISEVDIEGGTGNNAGKIENLSFYGAQWDAEDVSSFTYLHIDYFATTSTNFNLFLIDATAGIGGGAPEEPRYRFGDNGSGQDIALVQGSWQSVFIPLSAFTSWPTGGFSYDLNDIFQWKFDGNGTVYFDNIYFSTTNVLSTEEFNTTDFRVFPNPSNDVWNVVSNTSINSVTLFDMLGKQVLNMTPNSNEVSINTQSLKAGIYFARIESLNSSQTIKLIRK